MKFKLAANLLAAFFVICGNEAVDRNKFRTCQQSSFCRRSRGMEPGTSVYSLDVSTLQVSSGQAEVMLKHDEDRFRMEISALKNGVFRVKIREAFPLVPRFEVPEVLVSEPEVCKQTFTFYEPKFPSKFVGTPGTSWNVHLLAKFLLTFQFFFFCSWRL